MAGEVGAQPCRRLLWRRGAAPRRSGPRPPLGRAASVESDLLRGRVGWGRSPAARGLGRPIDVELGGVDAVHLRRRGKPRRRRRSSRAMVQRVGFGAVVLVGPAARSARRAWRRPGRSRFENVSSTVAGTQARSNTPSPRSVARPPRGGRSARRAARRRRSSRCVRCWYFRNRASSDSHRPVGSCTLAEMMAWVCSCGSTVREVCWRNSAAVIPAVSTWWTPSVPRRVTAPCRSNHAEGGVDRRCRGRRAPRRAPTGPAMRAHSTDTDFGAENVASNPRADESPNRRPKLLAGDWVAALEQRPQLLAGDRAIEPERLATVAPPPARRLVRVEVVVDRSPARTRARTVLGEPGVVVEQPGSLSTDAFNVVTRITTSTIHTDVPRDLPPRPMHSSVAPRPSRPAKRPELRAPFSGEPSGLTSPRQVSAVPHVSRRLDPRQAQALGSSCR